VAQDVLDATAITSDDLAPHVWIRLAMVYHDEKLLGALLEYYVDTKEDPQYKRLQTRFLIDAVGTHQRTGDEKRKARQLDGDSQSEKGDSEDSGGLGRPAKSRPEGQRKVNLGDSDDEVNEILPGTFLESITERMSKAVHEWQGSSPEKVKADFDEQYRRCKVPAYPDEYNTTQNKLQVMGARRVLGSREFVLRKGTSHPDADSKEEWFPLSAAASNMLERWAQSVPIFSGEPKAKSSRRDSVDFYARHNRHTFNALLKLVHTGPTLEQFSTTAKNVQSMAELLGQYCFRTNGCVEELERNSFVGCIPVAMTHKGDITVIPCGDGVEASSKDAFQAGVAKHFNEEEVAPGSEKASVFTSKCKKYTLLHPCFPLQARVFPEHVPSECEPPYRRYFQLEFDPARCIPPEEIHAGHPFFRLGVESGAVDGIFIPVVADFPDPSGQLAAAVLNRFVDPNGLAATFAIATPAPMQAGYTRAGLVIYMGGGSAGNDNDGDWARHWVLFQDLRVVPYFYTDEKYLPKLLNPHEAPAGFHTSPAPRLKRHRKEVGQLSEYSAIKANVPIPGGSAVRVRVMQSDKDSDTLALRRWAAEKRDLVANPLPRSLARLTGLDVPLGVALYAMSISDETHPGAFDTPLKPAPSGDGPSGGGGGRLGGRPHRQAFLQASQALSQAEGATPKRKESETVTAQRHAKRQVTSSQGAARSFALEPFQADWDELIEEMAQSRGSATHRLQHLMSHLQSCFPLGSALGPQLPPADFLQLQQLLLEYGSDTAPPVPEGNRQLLELCCRVLLPAAIRLNRSLQTWCFY
jgi:hypothetical protein